MKKVEIVLPKFVGNNPLNKEEMRIAFQSERVKEVICFVLGPPGTNIGQACMMWVKSGWLNEVGIRQKTKIVFCATPEEAVEKAKEVQDSGTVPIFWTCAVYPALNDIFFSNPDTLPFAIQVITPLDRMQLATRQDRVEIVKEIINGKILLSCKIISHPAPAPLVKKIVEKFGFVIEYTTSNSMAAKLCSEGVAHLCITTETARKTYGLVTVHEFGSPPMVFFGGLTKHGLKVLEEAHCCETEKLYGPTFENSPYRQLVV